MGIRIAFAFALCACGAVLTPEDGGGDAQPDDANTITIDAAVVDAFDAAPTDAALPDAVACPTPVEQPPPCYSCCQEFVQANPGDPICPVCRIALTTITTTKPGSCELDQPCCAGVYQGVCP